MQINFNSQISIYFEFIDIQTNRARSRLRHISFVLWFSSWFVVMFIFSWSVATWISPKLTAIILWWEFLYKKEKKNKSIQRREKINTTQNRADEYAYIRSITSWYQKGPFFSQLDPIVYKFSLFFSLDRTMLA